MTIKRPDFAYLLYYIFDGNKYLFSDSTASTGQINLGDLEPGYNNLFKIGMRLYSYKLLPDYIQNHFALEFNSTISYEGGDDVSGNLTVDVFFNPAVADLFLDKNIVKPGEFPLEVTFESSDFGNLDVKIYNLAGEYIKTVYSGPVEKGDTYIFHWKGDNEQNLPVSSGLYFIHANSKFYRGIKKVIIVR